MPRTLLIIGGLIAFAGFFMPWFAACGQEATGAQIAAHPDQYELPGEDSSSWVLLWFVLVAAVSLVLIGLAVQRVAIPGLIASILGAALVAGSYLSIEDKSLVDIKYGFWVELAGFGIALAGALLALAPRPRPPPNPGVDAVAAGRPPDTPGE